MVQEIARRRAMGTLGVPRDISHDLKAYKVTQMVLVLRPQLRGASRQMTNIHFVPLRDKI